MPNRKCRPPARLFPLSKTFKNPFGLGARCVTSRAYVFVHTSGGRRQASPSGLRGVADSGVQMALVRKRTLEMHGPTRRAVCHGASVLSSSTNTQPRQQRSDEQIFADSSPSSSLKNLCTETLKRCRAVNSWHAKEARPKPCRGERASTRISPVVPAAPPRARLRMLAPPPQS